MIILLLGIIIGLGVVSVVLNIKADIERSKMYDDFYDTLNNVRG